MDLQILFSCNVKCGRGWCLPERSWPDHRLLVVRGGRGEVFSQGKTQELRRGHIVFGYPGEEYGISQSERTRLVVTVFLFSVFAPRGKKIVLPAVFRPQLLTEVEGFPLLEQMTMRLADAIPLSPARSRGLNDSLLRAVLWLIREDQRSADNLQAQHIAFQELKPALDYPAEPGRLEPTTTELAALCGMSPNTFRRRMQQYAGKSPKQFLLQRRMERAKRLLLESPHTVEAIAEELGYQETAHFSHQFKQLVGMSPVVVRASPP